MTARRPSVRASPLVIWAAGVLVVAVLVGASAHARAVTAVRRLDLGALVVTLSTSETAQLFHIVDQLANWDPYTHRGYLRWAATSLVLDDDDKKALARQGEMRKARGRGNGFEQAFLVEGTIADAAASAVRTGLLTDVEAKDEAAILTRFSSKLAGLMAQRQAELDAFAASVVGERNALAPIVAKIAKFAGSREPLVVPVFLVANPETASGGGEANANRLIVEVPGPDSRGTLLHESLHAFLRPRLDEITKAAASAGVTPTELNEGVAYSLSPGLTDEPGVDRIADQLKRFAAQGRAKTDPYVRFYTIATALRPLLRDSLDRGETLETFLPKAIERLKASVR